MVTFSKTVRVPKALEGEKKSLLRRLKRKKNAGKIYCIAYSTVSDGLLDVFPVRELAIPFRQEQEIHVIGLAEGREEALLLVQEMIAELYEQTGGFAVREYFT